MHAYLTSLYSSTVERDTVNILIDVRFILRAIHIKHINALTKWYSVVLRIHVVQVRVLYAFN